MTVYPSDWHRYYGDKTFSSARKIAPHVLSIFPSGSVLEVGCGNGHWTAACVETGISDYVVADGPWNDRSDLIVDETRFVEIDLTKPVDFGRRFDLAICLEVAEHVAEPSARNVVKTLTCADIVLFSAAIPFQGGYGHVNERWPSWWRTLFAEQGYVPFDLIRPKFWCDSEIHYWYRQNSFVYIAPNRPDLMEAARVNERALLAERPLFDAVHPEKFEEIASYKAIAFKRLAKRLPSWFLQRIKGKLSSATT